MADPRTAEPDDGLARLRERLDATQRAAERLVEGIERRTSAASGVEPGSESPTPAADAEPPEAPPATPGGAPGDQARPGHTQARPPPAGYAVPDPGAAPGTLDELAALVRLVRALAGDELTRELGELARELLLLIRALIDAVVGRPERERTGPVEVTDIPIA